jgi:hypothetical protein
VEDLARAVADRTQFAADLFDEMSKHTHDGIGITRASYGEGEQKAHAIMAEAAKSLGLGWRRIRPAIAILRCPVRTGGRRRS